MAITESAPVSDGIDAIVDAIASNLSIAKSDAMAAVNGMYNLRLTIDKYGQGSANAVFDGVEGYLRKQKLTSEADDFVKNRPLIASCIESFSNDNPVALSIKAVRLAYSYEKTAKDIEVITDIRPVFNSRGDEVVEALVLHKLAITYETVDGTGRLDVTLDAADCLELLKACERAVLKAKAVENAFSGLKFPTKVWNDDEVR